MLTAVRAEEFWRVHHANPPVFASHCFTTTTSHYYGRGFFRTQRKYIYKSLRTSGISKALVTAKIPIASPQGRIQALEMEMKELRPEGRWQCQGQALSQGFWGGCLAVLVRFLGVVHLPVGKFGAHRIPMEWNLEEPRIVVDS